MRSISIAVVIPVGPNSPVLDVLDSVEAYLPSDREVVLINDSGQPLSVTYDRRLKVIEAPRGAPGVRGGLWIKLLAGFAAVMNETEPAMVLRMDTDALLTGSGLEVAALARLESDADVGLLGAYRYSPNGGARDFAPARRVFASEMGLRGLRHARLRSYLRDAVSSAGKDYEVGEHALGGAYIIRGIALRQILDGKLLGSPILAKSGLGEDFLMGLAIRMAGWNIGDFSRPDDPMSLRWIGLPDSPVKIVSGGKLITHSTKSWSGHSEREILNEFAALRHGSLRRESEL